MNTLSAPSPRQQSRQPAPQPARGITAGLAGCLIALMTLAAALPARALLPEERAELDLSNYVVTDPDASYFDVEGRMDLLRTTTNPLLRQQADEVRTGGSCRQILALPPLNHKIRIPPFYPNPEGWRLAAQPLFQFEDTVTQFAGAFVAGGDPYYADCLVRFLDKWAKGEALGDFYYDTTHKQAWYSVESTYFAAAMAYSIVRPHVDGRDEAKARIEDWMVTNANRHFAIRGDESSCCNNHFYRRALYSVMIGVLVDDDDLFRIGVSAVHSALHDLTADGALPMEMKRGRRATHYQNYALLYLIPIMEIVHRQGYPIYELTIDGRDIHDAVDFLMRILEDPANLGDYAPHEQFKGFLHDDQNFAWMEMYQARFPGPRVETVLRYQRPVYSRSAGGYATLYFMDPDGQQVVARTDQPNTPPDFEDLLAREDLAEHLTNETFPR